MKKKHLEKKKRKTVRDRSWDDTHEFTFTHDLAKHRRATVKLPESAAASNPLPTNFTTNATVIAHSKKWAFVWMEGEERLCLVDERLKEEGATLIAPGDAVLVEFEGEGEDALVRGVGPRRTSLSRPAGPHGHLAKQVVAANVDILIVVAAAAQPPFREGLVDRYLIAADVGEVQPILCINKMDLVEAEPEPVQTYRDLGVRVITTSCETGQGIPELREALSGSLSVLSGHSGVGKSSLLSTLDPALKTYTLPVSESSQRGRHATTGARLYELADGIRIIDTPGIRALGLWGVSPEEVAYYFPEIAELSMGCRFRDCMHTHEPQCAVREAVETGEVPQGRYDSYLRIRASLESETGNTPGRSADTRFPS